MGSAKTRFSVACAFALVLASGCAASTVFLPTGGNLTASILLNNGALAGVDVRGLATLGVTVNGTQVNDVTLTDSTGGLDPFAQTLPFGNADIAAIGAGGIVSGPFADLTFDLANPAFVNNFAVLILTASAAPVFGNIAADPGLSELLNASPLFFGFGFSNSIDLGNNLLVAQYSLIAVQSAAPPVPEPASALLAFGGLGGLLAVWKRRRAC